MRPSSKRVIAVLFVIIVSLGIWRIPGIIATDLAGKHFYSIQQLELGNSPTGSSKGSWIVAFCPQQTITWHYSDRLGFGTYHYDRTTGKVQLTVHDDGTDTASYNRLIGLLQWRDVTYVESYPLWPFSQVSLCWSD